MDLSSRLCFLASSFPIHCIALSSPLTCIFRQGPLDSATTPPLDRLTSLATSTKLPSLPVISTTLPLLTIFHRCASYAELIPVILIDL
ncbi:hypothetical protein FVER53590_25477 [Fusarium verticillioides]|nr:hypothetical protein FVER53590_25477 [Fusarium verticillioides]